MEPADFFIKSCKIHQKNPKLIHVIAFTEHKLRFSSFQKPKKSFHQLQVTYQKNIFQPIPCKHIHYANNLFSSSY